MAGIEKVVLGVERGFFCGELEEIIVGIVAGEIIDG
jgi:hypothetical protein